MADDIPEEDQCVRDPTKLCECWVRLSNGVLCPLGDEAKTFEVCACAFEDGEQVMWCNAHLKSREMASAMRDADAEHMRVLDAEVQYLRANLERMAKLLHWCAKWDGDPLTLKSAVLEGLEMRDGK